MRKGPSANELAPCVQLLPIRVYVTIISYLRLFKVEQWEDEKKNNVKDSRAITGKFVIGGKCIICRN